MPTKEKPETVAELDARIAAADAERAAAAKARSDILSPKAQEALDILTDPARVKQDERLNELAAELAGSEGQKALETIATVTRAAGVRLGHMVRRAL